MVARRAILVLGLVGVLVGGGWVYAQQRGSSRAATLSPQDYVDIQSLYAKYNQGSDFSDTAMWMSIWADDAVFKPGGQAITGTKALAEFRASLGPALDSLGEREQKIVILRFFGNLTQTQIAERVGISQMHVSRLLAKSLAILRGKLTET